MKSTTHARHVASGSHSQGRPSRLHAHRPEHSPAALLAVAQSMHESAGLRGQPLGLLVLQVADLAELEIVFGRLTAVAATQLLMKSMSAVAGAAGVALQTGADTFALVVPGRRGEDLRAAVAARLGAASSLEMDFDGEEIVLVPDVGAATVAGGESVEQAYLDLLHAVESARSMEQLRCDYLRREREAHTRPAELQSAHAILARNRTNSLRAALS